MNISKIILKIIRGLVELTCAPFSKEENHLTRFLLYSVIEKHRENRSNQTAASISGSQYMAKTLGFKDEAISEFSYPEHNILNLDVADGVFDVCVSDQVLEHVEGYPQKAIEESVRIVKPGGLIVWATVMTYPIHYGPSDMWRFTPEGLEYLLQQNGLRVIEKGSWGGALAVIFIVLRLATIKVPTVKWHPIRKLAGNPGKKFPIVVWCIARKN